MIARSTGRLARGLALALVLSLVAPTLGLLPPGTGWLPRASALEFPTDGPTDAGWNIQTNGAAAGGSLGDWYTDSAGGDHDHYLSIVVPCGWPAGTPVHVDLYSPDIHLDTTDPDHGDLEEPGNGGTAQFALYGPYADRAASDAVQPVSGDPLELATTDYPEVPVSGAEPTWKRLTTIDVATSGCGIYLLRSTILETISTAQNGWRLRVGDGTLGSVLTSDFDGVPGTNDELLVGIYETTFQNDGGTGGCITFHEYVQPGQTELRLHNFDADGNATLTYRAPSGATPGTPSLSGDAVWNNGRTGGDLISGGALEPGWWEIAHCANDHNQFIQEGQTRVMAFLVAPPEPIVSASKSGSDDPAVHGDSLTYSVSVTNGAAATGAAVDVEVTDVLPAGVTFVSCGWQDSAGSCGAAAGTVTGTRASVDAGATEVLQITVTVDADATSPLSNTATVDFTDAIGNVYGDASAGPVTTTVWSQLGDGEVCWVAADVGDDLIRFDRATGDVSLVGEFGANSIEAMALQPGTGTLYASNGGQLGTVDVTTGAFAATSSTLAPATDIDGLAFHPFTGVLYGTQRNGGADELYVIDPSDGSVVGAPITIAPVAGLGDIDDLAISSLDGTAYAIANNGTDDHLVTLDLDTGATTDLGIIEDGTGTRIEDIEGLSFSADGVLLASTGQNSGVQAVRNSLFEIIPTPGAATPSTATLVGAVGIGADYGGLACMSADANSVSGLLFQDLDADGTFDLGEPTRDGVTVELQRTDGTVLATATTAGGGAYSFTFAATGAFEVVLDTTDPSFDDELVIPASSVTIDYASAFGESRTVDFWYRRGRISGVVWLDLDHDGQRGAGDPLVTDGSVEVSLWRDEDGDGLVDGATDTLVAGPVAADASGAYAFTDLPQLPLSDPELPLNGYLLEVVSTGTRSLTLADVGADATDSDIDETTGLSDAVVLSAGEHVTDLDVGVWEPGALDVTVFEDVDGDGTLDAGDTRLTSVDVTLYRDTSGNGTLDVGTDAVVAGPTATDASGQVSVAGLEPDTYFVDVDDTDVAALVPSPTRSTGAEPVTVVITSGVTSAVEVGYYTPIVISGHVWDDLDADGLYEPAVPEPLRANVTVNLRDTEGGVIATTTTDAAGAYSFTGLVPGGYEIEVVAPGRVFSPQDVGADDTLDSDVDAAGSTGLVTYPSGVDGVDVDAGTYLRGSITGRVWLDLDADGADEPLDATNPEPSLEGVTVRLLDDTGTTVLATELTDATGAYGFTGLDPAGYFVEVDPGTRMFSPQVNDSDVDPADGRTGLITVTSDETESGWDAGLFGPVVLSGRLWVDDDGDATQNDGATGIVGLDVTISGPGGPYTVTTGADGQWSTASLAGVDLAPGTYTVDYPAPTGFAFTPADQGGDDTADSDVATADGTATVALLSGETADLDAGVYEPVSIGDRVFEDLDGDGVQDAGEPGLATTVRLHAPGDLSPGGALATTTSDAVTGAYSFTGLAPGDYVVVVEVPAGAEVTVADAPGDDTTDSDVTLATTDPLDPIAVSGTISLTSGSDDDAVDAGLWFPASLSGRLFDDINGDATDDGEPGWSDVRVVLSSDHDRDGTYTVVDETSTDLLGGYAFTDLRPGPYRVTVDTSDPDLPADAVLTTANQPLDVALVSDEDATGLDIGYRQPGEISGTVFEDVAGDGDPTGDPGLSGVTVELRLADGTTVVATDTTDASGAYDFTLLVPGSYEVHVTDPPRHVLTTGNDPETVVIAPGDTVTVDVGFQLYAPALTFAPDGSQRVEVGPVSDATVVHPHTVTNTGNVTDTYDLAVSGNTWTATLIADTDGDGVLDAGETTVVSDTGSLAPGASFDLLAVVTVPAGTARGVSDTVTVSATSQVGPNDPADPAIAATVTDVTTVVAPVLQIVKTSSLGGTLGTPGDRVTYTIEVTNLTLDAAVTDATGLTLDDVLADPSHGTFDASSVTIDGVTQPDPTTLPLDLGTLAPGDAVVVTVDLTLARPLADGTVVTDIATATVSNPQLYDAADQPVTEVSDTASDVVAASPIPQLVATATPLPGSIVEPSEVITYRTTISNRADATDVWRDVVFVQDLPGAGVSYLPGSATVGGVAIADGPDATSPFDVSGPGAALGDLAPGTSVVVTLQLVVDDPVVDGTVLTALAQAEGSNGGPLFGAVTHTVDATPGVSVTPNGAVTVEPGTQVVYPHLLTNTGNVTDVYDLAADSDTGFSVTLIDDLDGDGAFDPGEPVISSSRALAPDELQRLVVVVDVPTGVSSGTVDSVTVVASSTTDPTVVSQAFDVTTVVAGELAIVKTASPSSSAVNPGQVITYRIEVRNTGGALLPGVVVTDDTPSSATYRPGTTRLDTVPVPDRSDGDRNPLHGDAGGLALGDLSPGATRIITFDVQVRSPLPDRSLLVNVADATSADGQIASDSVSQLVTASPVIDVAKTATPVPGPVGPGDVVTYQVTVRNVGNAAATGVRLVDEVPRLTRYVPGSATIDGVAVADVGGGSPLTSAAGGLAIGDLQPGGAAVTVAFQVTVDDPLPDGTVITNVADVTTREGVTASSAPVRHTVRVTAGVTLIPDNDVLAEAGERAVHPHTVTNTGTGTDTLVLSATSASGWPVTLYRDDDGDGTWDVDEGTVIGSTGPLAPDASFAFFAVADVPLTAVVGEVDVATVRASSTTDAAVTSTAMDTTTVVAPEVAFAKNAVPSGDQVNPGQQVTYVLSVTNRGRVAAADLAVSDDTPAGTTYVAGSARVDGATALADDANGDGNPLSLANAGYLIEELGPGQTVTLSFSVTVDPAAVVGTTIDNLATLQPPLGDELTAQRTHTVTAGPVLDVTKSAQPTTGTSLTARDIVTYTITVANVGALTATGVRLSDDTPLNTRYVPGSATVAGVSVPDGAIDPNPFGSAAGGYLLGDLAPGAPAVTATFAVEVLGSVADDDTVINVALANAIEGASGSSPEVQHDIDVTPSVNLAPPRDVNSIAGVTVTLAHTLTNTGDVPDSYDLVATSARGWAVRIHEDADGDGVLDDTESEVATTPLLEPGAVFPVVVVVEVPSNAQTGVEDTVVVRARSVEDAVVASRVEDTITVIEGALTLAKTASPATVRPGTTATYTLTVRNSGSAPVEDLRLFDAAPAGTTYVPGSVERDGVAVPDAATGNPLEAGLALGTLASGAQTTVTFDVTVEADPERTVVINAAEAVATDTPTARAGTVQPYDTERGVDLTAGRRTEVAPGDTVSYPHTVTNTGDLDDEIVLSATSSFALPLRIVLDEDGDDVADDGEPELDAPLALASGQSADVVVVLEVPADAPAGLEDVIDVTATSLSEPTVTASAQDVTVVIAAVLQVVKAAQPDTLVEPGGLVRFGIAVTNTGTEPARGLTITDPTPVGTTYVPGSTLLDGVAVSDATAGVSPLEDGLLIGDLAPGSSVTVLFTVQVGTDVVPGAILTNVATAAADGLDPVLSTPVTLTVTGTTQLDIRKSVAPSGGVEPGGTVRWTITVTNVGSVEVPEVLLVDTLGPELTYLSGSTLVDGTPVGDGVAAGVPVAIGGLTPGQVRTVSFDTAVGQLPDGTVLQNAATATNGITGTSVLSNAANVTVDSLATGLPQTGVPTGRTLTIALALAGSGWALLYVARPERRPRPVLQRRSR